MAAPAPTASWKLILSAAAGASFAGVVGALVTDLGPWYYGLRFPPWKPPDRLFFRLQRSDYALVEVGLLWLSIVLLIVVLRRYSKTANWLLVPYLAWVTFAAALNYSIVRLNAPF
jgi:tryptophan-rich sensory protein